MTAQTVGSAVARRDKELQLVNWLRSQQDDIAMAAASHLKPSTIVRVAQGALRKDPKLMTAAVANPQSLIHCLLDAARLGHEPGTDQYWLIPFGQEVTGIEGYKGIVERMFRAGGVTSVVAQVVRQNDRYAGRGENTPPYHEYDEFAADEDRGALRGVYAYATFPGGGCSQVIRMGRTEVMAHKAKSRGANGSDSPWKHWEAAMWKKTALRALEPYVPTSTEWLGARARAQATASAPQAAAPSWAAASPEPPRVIASEVVDAEIVDEQPQQPAPRLEQPQQRRPRGQRQQTTQDPAPEDAPWPGDAAPAAPAGGVPDDPRDAVIWHLDRLKITAYAAQGDVMTQLAGRAVSSAEELSGDEAARYAALLARCASKADVDALARDGEVNGE